MDGRALRAPHGNRHLTLMKNPLMKLGWFDHLRKTSVILQSEVAECGLACLAMIANHHGNRIGLRDMRQQFPQTLRGMSVDQILKAGRLIGLNGRALRLELEHLGELKLPCILHWGMSHFVVLTKVARTGITILDPAIGKREVKLFDVDRLFTGVAVELLPANKFGITPGTAPLQFRQLWTKMSGVGSSLLAVFGLSLLIQFMMLLAPFQMQMSIDEAIPTNDAAFLTTLLVAVVILLIIQVAVGVLRSLLILHLSNTISFQVASNLFAHLMRLPVEFFERRHVGDIASRFVSLDKIRETLTTSFVEAIVDGMLVIGTLCAMFLYSPALGAIAAGGLGVYALAKWLTHATLRHATEEYIAFNARKDTSFLESIRGITTIRQHGGESDRHGLWQNAMADSLNANTRVGRLTVVQNAVNQFFLNLDAILILYVGALGVMANELTLGVLTATLAYRNQFSQRGAALIDKLQAFGLARLHLERVSDIALANPSKSLENPSAAPITGEGRVEIKGLEYRYGQFDRPVFANLNLTVAPGESITIIGASGNGKSTLLKCLLGMAEPTAGEVLVDGQAAAVAGRGATIAAVLQGDELFSGTVADNISFFGSDFDRERMIDAARWVGLHHVIERMPMQYDTPIGDIGKSLSAGQQQRLMIARALYRNPKVLVLDEATSHLDILSERFINENIRRLKITRICVAHRPETILTADRIYALEDGALTEVPRETMVAMFEKLRSVIATASESNSPVISPFDGRAVTDVVQATP